MGARCDFAGAQRLREGLTVERANVQLAIASEATEAVRGLAKLEQAEKNLETAVKVGNRTLKGRLDTESGLARVLKQVEGIELRAATAQQRRAAASLAAQKSAALLAEMTKKQASETRMATGWEKAAAQAQQEVDRAKQKRIADMAKGYDKAGKSAAGFGSKASAAMTRAAAVAAPVVAVLAALNKEFDYMMKRTERADAEARAMKDLVLALPEGAEGDALKAQIMQTGAEFGLKPGQSAETAMPLYAAYDKDGSGTLDEGEKKGFDSALKGAAALQATGTEAADATNLQLAASNMGVGGMEASAKAMKAAQMSMRGTDVIAKAAAPMSQFDDFDTGMATITALSKGELNEGRIPERVKDAQMALSSANDTSEFSKKYGLAGLTQGEKIEKLYSAAVESGDVKGFTDQFSTVKGMDEGKSTSLALLVQQGALYKSSLEELKAVKPEEATAAVDKLRNDKLTRSVMATDQATAGIAVHGMIGEGSDKAYEARMREIALGQELTAHGGGQAVDPETGLPKPLSGIASSYDRISGTVKAAWNGMPVFGREDSGLGKSDGFESFNKNQAALTKAIEENNRLLAENNQATAANTAGTKKTTPVGGNPSNAEEKY